MKSDKKRSDCPLNFGLETFGDRWTLLVIRDLIFSQKHYFGEFLTSEEKISTNILSDRLFMLEQSGIVLKTVDTANKSKFIYRLTCKGIDLLPVLIEIMLWSSRYDENTGIDPKLAKAITHNKEEFLESVSIRLKKELAEH